MIFLFSLMRHDIRKYGSQGQQRTAALSLKLAEIELVKQLIQDTPVLLLDDVLSELDSNRQNYLLNSIHDIQTIITCTGLDEFVKNRFHINNRFFKVTDGSATDSRISRRTGNEYRIRCRSDSDFGRTRSSTKKTGYVYWKYIYPADFIIWYMRSWITPWMRHWQDIATHIQVDY